MKNMFAFLFLLVFCSKIEAETFVFSETYRTFKKNSTYQTSVVWAQQSLAKKVGLFGWGQVGTTYRQTYGGVYVKPANWLQVGIGGGAEQATNKTRMGSFLYASKKRYSTFAIYENGGSGYWYLTITDISFSKNWSIGTHSQAYIGHGVRAEYRFKPIGKWTPSIRPAMMWDKKGQTSVILGLRMTYFK